MLRIGKTAGALVFAVCTFGSIHGQTPQPAPLEQTQTTTPLAFAVVSVKPDPPGTFPIVPAFMRDKGARILGVQRMSGPAYLLVGYAYHLQKSEAVDAFRKQPDWTKNKIYTVSFRADGEPTRDQVREMMRTMLAERFGLQNHEFSREGMVNKLVMSKPGVLGPNLKPHPPGATCSTQASSSGNALDASKPPGAYCGFKFTNLPEGVMRVEITDTTMTNVGPSLASLGTNGLETHPMVDATGLTGKYDLTLEYRPASMSQLLDSHADDGGVPTLIQAMKEQLGLRVESGQGPVRMVIIDHISEPTPD